MASKQQIIEAANDSARQLGYEKLKDLQLKVVSILFKACTTNLSRSASRV